MLGLREAVELIFVTGLAGFAADKICGSGIRSGCGGGALVARLCSHGQRANGHKHEPQRQATGDDEYFDVL
jgi:hypothetical protein